MERRRGFSPLREENNSSDRSNWLLASSIIAILLLLAILGIVIALIVRVNQLHDKVDDIPTTCPSPCNTSSDNSSMIFEVDSLPQSVPQASDDFQINAHPIASCGPECPAECDINHPDDESVPRIIYEDKYEDYDQTQKILCQMYGSSSYWFFLMRTTDPIVLVNDGKAETHEEVCIDAVSDATSFKECLGAEYNMNWGLCIYFFKCSGLMDAKHSEFLEIERNVTKNFNM